MLKIILITAILIIKVQTIVFCDPVSDAEKIINEVSKALYFDSLEDSNDSVKEGNTWVGLIVNACAMYLYMANYFNNDLLWIINIWF